MCSIKKFMLTVLAVFCLGSAISVYAESASGADDNSTGIGDIAAMSDSPSVMSGSSAMSGSSSMSGSSAMSGSSSMSGAAPVSGAGTPDTATGDDDY
jgi:hypothetical protein